MALTEEQLVAKLRSGTKDDFAQLYDYFSGALYSIVKRMISDDELVQDILQDSFVKIWKNAHSYDQSKGRLFTWMLNITRNTTIDFSRSKHAKMSGKIRNIEDSVGVVNKQTCVAQSPETIGISEMVQGLAPEQKVIIEMMYFKGYTQEEVSDELGIPLGTVKTRTRSALMKLRETFKSGTA